MRIFSLSNLAYLLAICATGCAQIPVGTWTAAAPLPQARAEHAVIGLDGKVYAIAGGVLNAAGTDKQGNGASTLVEEYDPATDRWRVRSPLPRVLTHVGLAALDGKIYAIGGFVADIHKDAQ